jgi:TRAP-type C4-dicarboxylate transport system permease small subunit
MYYLTRVLDLFAAVAIFLMASLVCTSVVFRYFLNHPILMAEDLLTMLLGLAIFAAYAKITLYREHVSVDLLGAIFAQAPRLDAARNVIIDVATLGMLGLIAWRLIVQAVKYYGRGNYTPTMEWPLWPAVSIYAALVTVTVAIFAVRLVLEWSGHAAPLDHDEEDLF